MWIYPRAVQVLPCTWALFQLAIQCERTRLALAASMSLLNRIPATSHCRSRPPARRWRERGLDGSGEGREVLAVAAHCQPLGPPPCSTPLATSVPGTRGGQRVVECRMVGLGARDGRMASRRSSTYLPREIPRAMAQIKVSMVCPLHREIGCHIDIKS